MHVSANLSTNDKNLVISLLRVSDAENISSPLQDDEMVMGGCQFLLVKDPGKETTLLDQIIDDT